LIIVDPPRDFAEGADRPERRITPCARRDRRGATVAVPL